MEYRKLGRTNFNVSAISLGTEYLINLPQEHVVRVIHEAIAQGVNYFDLFFAQPEFRDNMGIAFKDHRKKVYLSAHLGSSDQDGQYQKTHDLKICDYFFFDFLKRYNTDYVDVLYLHNIDLQEDYDKVMNEGMLELALKYKKEGKARFLGFSGHTVSTALQAVESDYIDVLTFPVNPTGNAVEGKNDLFKACVNHNIGLVAMKPFAGGKLLQEIKNIDAVRWYRGGADKQMEKALTITPIQCISYALSQIGVSTVIPGCKDVDQLSEVLAYWNAGEEEKDFSAILEHFNEYISGECVYCNHCLPCPSGIDIGQTIRLFEMAQNGLTTEIRDAYNAMKKNASDCIQCGNCEERCPFDVEVIPKMEQAEKLFS
ncbi:MAG: aldo/keto reductase [bacterium]